MVADTLLGKLESFSSSPLLRSTAIYVVTGTASAAILILLMPIMTRYLSPEEYGIVTTFLIASMAMVSFVGLNIAPAIQRAYVDNSKEDLAQYIGTGFVIIVTSLAVNFAILFLARELIGNLLLFSPNWLVWILLTAFGSACTSILLVIWRMEEKPLRYGVFTILSTAVQIGLAIFFVVALGLHWQGRLLSIIITTAVFAVVGIYILYREGYIRLKFNKAYALEMLRFGIPLVPQGLSIWAITMSDRLFINAMVGTEATGLYAVGYAVGNIIGLLQHAFSLAWVPMVFKKLKSGDEEMKKNLVRLTYLHHSVIMVLALLVGLAAPFILSILAGEEFQGAYKFVLLVSLGYAFHGMYLMVACYITYVRKIHILAILSSMTCILNLALNYFLIKQNGAIGAAQSTLISFVVLYLMTFWLSNRLFKMPWFAPGKSGSLGATT